MVANDNGRIKLTSVVHKFIKVCAGMQVTNVALLPTILKSYLKKYIGGLRVKCLNLFSSSLLQYYPSLSDLH